MIGQTDRQANRDYNLIIIKSFLNYPLNTVGPGKFYKIQRKVLDELELTLIFKFLNNAD